MKIIFDKTVSEKLAKFDNADFVLDFDHELSEKNEAIDACAGELVLILAVFRLSR